MKDDPTTLARLMEITNFFMDAISTHQRTAFISFGRTDGKGLRLYLTDSFPASAPFFEAISEACEYFEFDTVVIEAAAERVTMELVLAPTLEQLGSPITESLDQPHI